jgi:hypothetical protein
VQLLGLSSHVLHLESPIINNEIIIKLQIYVIFTRSANILFIRIIPIITGILARKQITTKSLLKHWEKTSFITTSTIS